MRNIHFICVDEVRVIPLRHIVYIEEEAERRVFNYGRVYITGAH